MFSNDRRSRVYRTEGERFHKDCVFEFDRFQSKGIMVWGGISYNFKTDLVFVDGSLSSNSYIEQIIRPHIIPFMNTYPEVTVLQQDNARPHAARNS